jgi:peptidoglycan/LPS O-acetylase OafA/YrhL
VEVWRVIPAAVFGVEGLVLVLVAMAQSRDRRHATHLTVIGTGLAVLIVTAGLTLAIAGLFPVLVGWGLAFLLAMALLAMLHTG